MNREDGTAISFDELDRIASEMASGGICSFLVLRVINEVSQRVNQKYQPKLESTIYEHFNEIGGPNELTQIASVAPRKSLTALQYVENGQPVQDIFLTRVTSG